MKTLSDRLKLAMKGPPVIKIVDLARACNIKSPSVSDWLNGRTQHLEGSNLLSAAKCLNVDPLWLATGKGLMRPANQEDEDIEIDMSDKELVALIKLIKQLPKENRPHAKRLLDVAHELPTRGEKKKTQNE